MNADRHRLLSKRVSACICVCLWALVSAVHAEDTPRSSMRKGLKAYKTGDYTNAVEHLEKTVLEFPSIGNYNLGSAQYRMGDYKAADESFSEALRWSCEVYHALRAVLMESGHPVGVGVAVGLA